MPRKRKPNSQIKTKNKKKTEMKFVEITLNTICYDLFLPIWNKASEFFWPKDTKRFELKFCLHLFWLFLYFFILLTYEINYHKIDLCYCCYWIGSFFLYFLLQMHEYTWTIQTYTINVTGFAWKLTKAKKYKLEYEQTIYAL